MSDPDAPRRRHESPYPASASAPPAQDQPTDALPTLPPPTPPVLPPPGPPPGASAPSGGPRILGMPAWAAAVVGVVIAGLVAALVVVLVSGGDEADASADQGAVSAAYSRAAFAQLNRLSASANATGRSLARASAPRDVARVARAAGQQLELVSEVRVAVASNPTAGAADRRANGTLQRAVVAHRNYLVGLSRLRNASGEAAVKRIATLRRLADRTLDGYRSFLRVAPEASSAVTTAGMADLSGLREAAVALRNQEREAAEAAEEAANQGSSGSGGSGSSSSSGGDSSRGPVVSSVSAGDEGGTIFVAASYCDRTPGAVNDFYYTFQIIRGGVIEGSDGYGASQTRACNDISMTLTDSFGVGTYEVRVVVDNVTNGVTGSGSSSVYIN